MITYLLQPTGFRSLSLSLFSFLLSNSIFHLIAIRTVVKLPSNVSKQLWIVTSTNFDKFPSHCLSLISNLLQLNTVPDQMLENNLTTFILQENMTDELKFAQIFSKFMININKILLIDLNYRLF